MIKDNIISAPNVSTLWARVFHKMHHTPGREVSNLIACIEPDGTDPLIEDAELKSHLDDALNQSLGLTTDRVANTIFPSRLWNPELERDALFQRYETIWPLVKKCTRNKDGVYFRRMTAFKPKNHQGESINQLGEILDYWNDKRTNRRRSAFQVSVFDATRDHKKGPYLPFPCLNHVTFVPCSKDNTLTVTGFYPYHYIFDRGYGNYLGLLQLGKFVAHEMGLNMNRLLCISNTAVRGSNKVSSDRYNNLAELTKRFTEETCQK